MWSLWVSHIIWTPLWAAKAISFPIIDCPLGCKCDSGFSIRTKSPGLLINKDKIRGNTYGIPKPTFTGEYSSVYSFTNLSSDILCFVSNWTDIFTISRPGSSLAKIFVPGEISLIQASSSWAIQFDFAFGWCKLVFCNSVNPILAKK